MEKALQKRSTGQIYYGLDEHTGQLRHISTVPSGLACHCLCPACHTPLEARRGNIRRHHFAHVSKYDCYYAAETAVYVGVRALLEEQPQLLLPTADLDLPGRARRVPVVSEKLFAFDQVTLDLDNKTYPPLLFACAGVHKLRLLLSFGALDRLEIDDVIQDYAPEAREGNYACLLAILPSIDESDSFTPERLKALLHDSANLHWIYSRPTEVYLQNLQRLSRPIQDYTRDCPLRNYTDYVAFDNEPCYQCPFLVSCDDELSCVGHYGILQAIDLQVLRKAPTLLKDRVATLQRAYTRARQLAEEAEAARRAIRARTTSLLYQQRASIQDLDKQAVQSMERSLDRSYHYRLYSDERDEEYAYLASKLASELEGDLDPDLDRELDQDLDPDSDPVARREANHRQALLDEVRAHFDARSPSPIYDSDGNRYVQCKLCQKVLPTTEMSEYGGPGQTNLGICSQCAREHPDLFF